MPDGTHDFDPVPVVKVIATAASITVGIANDRQITFQSGFEGDEPDDVVNARFDRLMAIADRQKARYEVPELEDTLAEERKKLGDFKEDFERVELGHKHKVAEIEVQIEELKRIREEEREKKLVEMNRQILEVQLTRENEFNVGLHEHQKSGRRGSYHPRGATAANLERIDKALAQLGDARDKDMERWDVEYDAQIAKLEAEIVRMGNDRDQHRDNLLITINRYEESIAAHEEKLAKRRSAAGG